MLYHNHQVLRRAITHTRTQLLDITRSAAALGVCHRIQQLAQYKCAKNIVLYFAINGEVDLNPLWEMALSHHKYCYFPIMLENKTMQFTMADTNTPLTRNQYNIFEPFNSESRSIKLEHIDILCAPLVAFDNKGTRLGMGAGFYDRTLAIYHPKFLLGIAYDFQFQPYIMRRSWDIPLDAVITPTTLFAWQ